MSQTDAILDRLTRLHPKKIDLVLDRIERLLAALGHPERKLPLVIHVGGTNGKGSVIAFLGAMLRAEGYGVHVYTSPHLVRFNERIVIGKRASSGSSAAPIGEEEMAHTLSECEKANGDEPITFFEITTAAAILAFSRHPADIILLEVGLGGRYDATNVVAAPAMSVLTQIGYDHTEFLGNTLAKIAFEKAGILKPGIPAIIGPQDPEALSVIEQEATRIKAPLSVFGQDFFSYEQQGRFIYEDNKGLLDLPLPSLTGRHQLDNAGIALACLRHLEAKPVSDKAIDAGLGAVTWPARMQRLTEIQCAGLPWRDGVPEIWLDGGHNPMAAGALANAVAELEEVAPRSLYIIISIMNNKDIRGFLEPFRTLACEFIALAIPGSSAGATPHEICAVAGDVGLPCTPAETLESAFSLIKEKSESLHADRTARNVESVPRILICGSLYFAGYVLAQDTKPMA